MPDSTKKTTMRLEPDAVNLLRKAEALHKRKRKVKPNHSEALRLASAAWIREIESQPQAA